MISKNITYYFPNAKLASGFKLFKELGTSLTGFYRVYTEKFDQLVQSGGATIKDNRIVILNMDVAFTSPSGVVSIVTGNSEMGWMFWNDLEELRERV